MKNNRGKTAQADELNKHLDKTFFTFFYDYVKGKTGNIRSLLRMTNDAAALWKSMRIRKLCKCAQQISQAKKKNRSIKKKPVPQPKRVRKPGPGAKPISNAPKIQKKLKKFDKTPTPPTLKKPDLS